MFTCVWRLKRGSYKRDTSWSDRGGACELTARRRRPGSGARHEALARCSARPALSTEGAPRRSATEEKIDPPRELRARSTESVFFFLLPRWAPRGRRDEGGRVAHVQESQELRRGLPSLADRPEERRGRVERHRCSSVLVVLRVSLAGRGNFQSTPKNPNPIFL